jgi:hypothetical protein
MNDFTQCDKDNFRYKIMLPFKLLLDLEQYRKEKEKTTLTYKKLEHFIWAIKESIEDYPNFKAFLWTLESRGIKGKYYGVLTEEELKEQMKILNMFLRLAYWN